MFKVQRTSAETTVRGTPMGKLKQQDSFDNLRIRAASFMNKKHLKPTKAKGVNVRTADMPEFSPYLVAPVVPHQSKSTPLKSSTQLSLTTTEVPPLPEYQPVVESTVNEKYIGEQVDSTLKKSPTFPMAALLHGSKSMEDKPTKIDKILLEPYNYLRLNPGKEVRNHIIDAFNEWMKVPVEQLDRIKKITQMLHTSSLLIDDIEDNSQLRRGFPVAHHLFGEPQSMNCANYVYFLALAEVSKFNNPKMVEIFTDEMLNLHRGQGMELFWRDTHIIPTEEEYVEMVNNKTGGLLRLAVKMMQEVSQTDVDYIAITNLIGIHFQIRDDYQNLISKEYTNAKGFCEDISEGKYSFPIIHSINATPLDHRLVNIIIRRPADVDLKKHAVSIIEGTNSFEYTKEYLAVCEEKGREELAKFPPNPILEKIMKKLAIDP